MLPIYELTIDDTVLGMYALALVSNPAMEAKWVAFNGEKQAIKCSIINNEERKVLCVICRCDFPIYRIDEYTKEEFYVVYHKDTIEKMAQMLLKNGYQGAINIEHDENAYIDGVELTQIFIKDTEKGISPAGFEDIENYSLFGVYKIENDAVWNAIKNGAFVGVSLEGVFKIQKDTVTEEKETISNLKELFEWLKNK